MKTATISRLAWIALARFAASTSGVAATEFAILLPVMLTLYIGGVSITQAISIDRKVTLASHTIADLTAQASTVSAGDLTNILNAGTAIVAPYATSPLKMTVTSVKIDANGKATVEWSETRNGSKRAGDVSALIPTALKVPNTGLVWGEASYAFTPPIGYVITGTVTLDDQSFMRPRLTTVVAKQ